MSENEIKNKKDESDSFDLNATESEVDICYSAFNVLDLIKGDCKFNTEYINEVMIKCVDIICYHINILHDTLPDEFKSK
jgi:hypothetical protein